MTICSKKNQQPTNRKCNNIEKDFIEYRID